jgi:hypothetical protein
VHRIAGAPAGFPTSVPWVFKSFRNRYSYVAAFQLLVMGEWMGYYSIHILFEIALQAFHIFNGNLTELTDTR